MDKALEVIMVAMILVVASVVVLAMLQGRTGDFSDYTQNQTSDSDCGLAKLQFQRAIDCSRSSTSNLRPSSADQIRSDNSHCAWASSTSTAYNTVC